MTNQDNPPVEVTQYCDGNGLCVKRLASQRPAVGDEAVERVARAIYGEARFDDLGQDVRETMFAVSRAAIAAMQSQAPATGDVGELERWGLRWKGYDNAAVEPMADGYWTPWHIAAAKLTELQAEVERLRATRGDAMMMP